MNRIATLLFIAFTLLISACGDSTGPYAWDRSWRSVAWYYRYDQPGYAEGLLGVATAGGGDDMMYFQRAGPDSARLASRGELWGYFWKWHGVVGAPVDSTSGSGFTAMLWSFSRVLNGTVTAGARFRFATTDDLFDDQSDWSWSTGQWAVLGEYEVRGDTLIYTLTRSGADWSSLLRVTYQRF